MVSTNLNLLVKNIFKLYLPVNRLGKSRGGKGKSSGKSSMRMMFLVWSSGQSN